MDIGEEIGITITAVGALIDAAEVFFPGSIGKMTPLTRKTVFAVGTVLVIVGLLVMYLSPVPRPAVERLDAPVTINGACNNVQQKGGRATFNCPTQTPPIPQRNLLLWQKQAIWLAVKGTPPESVLIIGSNSNENYTYAQQFVDVLERAHWKRDLLSGDQRPSDDKIRVGWQHQKTAGYLAFVRGLKNAHVKFIEAEFELSDMGTGSADSRFTVSLDVGVAPKNPYQVAADRAQ